jgi:hypothetical protein
MVQMVGGEGLIEGGFKMSTELFPYEYVPAGFEIVIDFDSGSESWIQGQICPSSKGGIWNLWWNTTLSDNPETWDDEVKAINRMQTSPNKLKDDYRLIRAQMAESCRFHPLFPQSIDILCQEIGIGRFSSSLRLGCEGRGLLETLGKQNSQTLDDQRRESLTGHLQALTKWLAQSPQENAIDSMVSGFLGQPTDSKIIFVKELIATINPEEPSIVAIREICRQQCIKTHGESAVTSDAFPHYCFKCEQSSREIPNCQCCHIMLLNAALICTGVFGEERPLGKEREFFEQWGFVEENILAYAAAVNSWLSGTLPESVKWPLDGGYVTSDSASQIAQRVHSSLDKKDEFKEWLAACLLKTLKGNQRWLNAPELIDNYPEVTSWLTELSGRQ